MATPIVLAHSETNRPSRRHPVGASARNLLETIRKPPHWTGCIALTTSFAACNGPAQTCVPGAQIACACPGGVDGARPLSWVGPGDSTVCDAVPLDCLAGSDQGFAGDWETVDFTAAAA